MSEIISDDLLIKLHRKLVTAAIYDVLELSHVHGRPVREVVNDYYERLPSRSRLIAVHHDPLGLAFDLAGDEAPSPSSDDPLGLGYRIRFNEVWSVIVDNELPLNMNKGQDRLPRP